MKVFPEFLQTLACTVVFLFIANASGASDKPSPSREFMALRVADPATESGIPGVRVRIDRPKGSALPDQVLITDADGEVAVEIASTGTRDFRVWVADERFVPRVVQSSANKKQKGSFIYHTKKALPIGGQVVNERGQPLAGATVQISLGPEGWEQQRKDRSWARRFFMGELARKTDLHGNWSFPNVPEDTSEWSFIATLPGYRTTYFTAGESTWSRRVYVSPRELTSRTARILLREGLSVFGQVVDKAGKPLASAKVKSGKYIVFTDTRGRFLLGAEQTALGQIEVSQPGYIGQALELRSQAEASDLVIELSPARVVRIRVLDPTDQPLAGVRVSSKMSGDGLAAWEAFTDKRGWVTADSSAEDALIGIVKDGYETTVVRTESAKGDEMTVRIAKIPTVTARAIDAETGKPIPTIKVSWLGGETLPPRWMTQHWLSAATTARSSGQFEVRMYQLGRYEKARFKAEAEGYQAMVSKVMKLEDEVQLDFKMTRLR